MTRAIQFLLIASLVAAAGGCSTVGDPATDYYHPIRSNGYIETPVAEGVYNIAAKGSINLLISNPASARELWKSRAEALCGAKYRELFISEHFIQVQTMGQQPHREGFVLCDKSKLSMDQAMDIIDRWRSAAPAQHARQGQRVDGGKLFGLGPINVRGPLGDGWFIAGNSEQSIGFVRRGLQPDESFVAQVAIFRIMDTKDLLETVRQSADLINPGPRFVPLTSRFDDVRERSYPCVRFTGTYQDVEALGPTGVRSPKQMEYIALFCQQPGNPELGFVSAYSHRGGSPATDLEVTAQTFIKGVKPR